MAWGGGRAAIAAVVLGLCLGLGVAPRAARAEDPNFIAVGGGVYDVFHHYTAGQARLEFRFADRWLFLKPMLGVLVTTKGSVMGYGGFRIDLYLGNHFVVTPNAAVGAFYKGSGKDLGSVVEFKTGGEFAYRFDDHSRLGRPFEQLSNAGSGEHNPRARSRGRVRAFPFA